MIDFSSPHRKRLVLILLAFVIVGWVVWEARQSLVPFVLGAIFAYLMAPLVNLFQVVFPKRGVLGGFGKIFAILLTYAVFISAFITAGYYLIPPLIRETIDFVEAIPRYWEISHRELGVLMTYYEEQVPDQVKEQIEDQLGNLASQALSTARSAFMATVGAVSSIIGFGAGLALLPLWMFYVLKDRNEGAERFYTMWPEHWQNDVRNIVMLIDRVFSAYIRGQIFVSLTVGVATGVTMWLIGVEPALVLGVLAGLTNLIPILGPIIAFFIIALVTLATEPDRLILVAIAFIGIQQLESTFLVPRIHGYAVRVHPAIVMILVVLGGAIWGLWGMIAILPIAAAVRDVFVYVYHRIDIPEEERKVSTAPRLDRLSEQQLRDYRGDRAPPDRR